MKISFTLKPYLLKRRKKADGSYPIYIRITKAGKYSLQSTGISVDEKQWNPEKAEVRRNHPKQRVLNSRIQSEILKLQQLIDTLPDDASLDDIRNSISDSGTDQALDFFAYAERFIEALKADRMLWPVRHTRVTVGYLREYLNADKFPFEKLDHNILEGFKRYLKDVKGNNPNTVHKHFKSIKKIIKKALLDDLIQINPFDKLEPIKLQKAQKTRLSLDQIQAIEALKLQPGSWMDVTRDAFLFSFYNAGIRFGDIVRLKWCHIIDGRLKYNMAKTGTGKNIKLLKPALAILEKYQPAKPDPDAFIFPILKPNRDYSDDYYLKAQISSKNVIANKQLKKLAAMAGIQDNVSFHVSRHSFADYARTAGISIYDISKALGHSDIQITQAYLKSFDETSLDASMEQLFG
ncbi:MAG: site-specific integrase [Candidatus Cyclonatronum sp.]|uniref:site-specific integrase n=1 Tax=Cyclonatronum sp. TaxID=3024185 RepID=UPI0025B98EA7|nr:site-specific integrase [Cyclonatronum sp.]MCH8487285.1 site-specific integrase [Cyclonatronum sp.]